jgi:hypothetical protein
MCGAHLLVSLSPGVVLPLAVVGGFLLSPFGRYKAPVLTGPVLKRHHFLLMVAGSRAVASSAPVVKAPPI